MQFTQALLSQLLQHLTNHFTTNPKALLISNSHWEKDKYWFTSNSAAAMARLTAAALMNWGRAPTTVRSCVSSANLSESLSHSSDDVLLIRIAQIRMHRQAKHTLTSGLGDWATAG